MTGTTTCCNICGGTEFGDFRGRIGVQCLKCGSLERGRTLALHLASLKLKPGSRILHIAPEETIWRLFSARPEVSEYVLADFSPSLYKFATLEKIDFCQLEKWPSNHFDVILHSHVLEHSQCNIAYTLFHLHRMLSPEGQHIFILPFTVGAYEESFQKMGTEERTRRFGQWDHLRRFGVADIGDHIGKIVRMPTLESVDAEVQFGRDVLTRANIPENLWRGFNACTVLNLAKSDYLLV